MGTLKIYVILTIGGLLQGIAMGIFLFPHAIPSGGAAAISVLMKYLLNIPYEVSLWLVNFTLLFTAVKWLGYASTIRTMYTVSVISVTINLTHSLVNWPVGNVWLDLIWGSLLMGIGVGLLVRQRASNGGMVILALIVHIYKGYAPGKVMFWINSFIFFITALVVDWKIIVLALLNQWLATRVIDMIYKLDLAQSVLGRLAGLSWRRR
jgi:uncharacterized membrane-anchored protein YitT (DUF2179 family)